MKKSTNKTKSAPKKTKERWLLVTNKQRGIRYGRNDTWKPGDGPSIVLTEARRVYYFSAENGARGIDSLATMGPQKGSKIGPLVDSLTEMDVSTVVVCSPESRQAWIDAKWS